MRSHLSLLLVGGDRPGLPLARILRRHLGTQRRIGSLRGCLPENRAHRPRQAGSASLTVCAQHAAPRFRFYPADMCSKPAKARNGA